MQQEATLIMRIGIRLAISGLVLASIMVSAIGVHVLWWRTAEANSHALADTINQQIVSAVEKELTTITTEARSAPCSFNTSLRPARRTNASSSSCRNCSRSKIYRVWRLAGRTEPSLQRT